MKKNEEREYKWDASPRGAFVRFLCALNQTTDDISGPVCLRITDRYLDNDKQDFSRRKVALRIRYSAGAFESTLKTRSALKNGLACRTEITRPLANAHSFVGALRLLEKSERWKNRSLMGLSMRFTLRNFRSVYKVRFADCVCEAALDNYVTVAGFRRLRRREIELELKAGSVRDFSKLVKILSARCGLQPARISKVAGAEMLLQNKI